MRKIFPYLLISVAFFLLLIWKHPQIFQYKFNPSLIHDYLRSQDVEDPQGKIKDRIFLSDSDIYISSGYLYATGGDPVNYNLHPPLIKYLFGVSTLLTGNPFWIQIIFGLAILCLTYFFGTKLFENRWIAFLPIGLLLIDPVFGGMMNEALLDLGSAFFALAYIFLNLFYPENFIFQGIVLGLFAASKFWSTAVIFVVLVFAYKLIIQKQKINYKKVLISFLISGLVFALTYTKSFMDAGGMFNIFSYQGRVLKFMLTHNSAGVFGGPIILFITGFFAPWWQAGVARASDWTLLWPISLAGSIFMVIKTKIKDVKFLIYLLPFIYLILSSTQVPFTRYFVIILPFLYLGLTDFIWRICRR